MPNTQAVSWLLGWVEVQFLLIIYPVTYLLKCPYLLTTVKVEKNFADYLQVTKVVTALEAQRRLCGDRIFNKLESHVIKIISN